MGDWRLQNVKRTARVGAWGCVWEFRRVGATNWRYERHVGREGIFLFRSSRSVLSFTVLQYLCVDLFSFLLLIVLLPFVLRRAGSLILPHSF